MNSYDRFNMLYVLIQLAFVMLGLGVGLGIFFFTSKELANS